MVECSGSLLGPVRPALPRKSVGGAPEKRRVDGSVLAVAGGIYRPDSGRLMGLSQCTIVSRSAVPLPSPASPLSLRASPDGMADLCQERRLLLERQTPQSTGGSIRDKKFLRAHGLTVICYRRTRHVFRCHDVVGSPSH